MPLASRLSPLASRLSPLATRLSPRASRLSPVGFYIVLTNADSARGYPSIMFVRIISCSVGAGVGAALAIAGASFVGELTSGGLLAAPLVTWIATPATQLLSWTMGWSLQQEGAIIVHALGVLLTVASLGALAGGAAALVATHTASSARELR